MGLNLNILNLFWGIIAFFLSVVIYTGVKDLIWTVLGLLDGTASVAMRGMTYLTIFAIIYMVPMNVILDKSKEEVL